MMATHDGRAQHVACERCPHGLIDPVDRNDERVRADRRAALRNRPPWKSVTITSRVAQLPTSEWTPRLRHCGHHRSTDGRRIDRVRDAFRADHRRNGNHLGRAPPLTSRVGGNDSYTYPFAAA